jgi:hypothetical protein
MLSQLLSRTVTVRTLLLGAAWTVPCLGLGFVAGKYATPPSAARAHAVHRPADSAVAVATHPGGVSDASTPDTSEESVFGKPYGERKLEASRSDTLGEPQNGGVETYRVPSSGGKETIVVIIREGARSTLPSLR